MAVNNGNFHKLPLKSVLNLNRFENEIDNFKIYRKLNSPVYGGVLSNFYKKDIELEEGHYFVMYDSFGRLWTKKYNIDTTDTDVYCDYKFIKSFSNESAKKERLEYENNIIAGNKEYPIYRTDYAEYSMNSCFVSKGSYSYLLVQYWKPYSYNRYIDIYDISGTEKELVKTITWVLDNTTKSDTFFIQSMITTTTKDLLHISLLPYGKVEYEEVMKNNTYICLALFEDSNVTQFDEINLSIVAPALTGKASDCTEAFGLYPCGLDVDTGDYPIDTTFYTSDNNIYQNGTSGVSSYITDEDFNSWIESSMYNALSSGNISPVYDNKKLLVFYGYLFAFPSSNNLKNNFDFDIFLGKYITKIDVDNGFTLNNHTITIANNNCEHLRISSLKQDIFYVKPSTLHNRMQDIYDDSSYMQQIYGDTDYSITVRNSDDTETENKSKALVVRIDATPTEYFYLEANKCFGRLDLELKELNMTFNLMPNIFNIFSDNVFSPVFNGIYVGTFPRADIGLAENSVYKEDPLYISGNKKTVTQCANVLISGFSRLSVALLYNQDTITDINSNIVNETYFYKENNKLDDITDKCFFDFNNHRDTTYSNKYLFIFEDWAHEVHINYVEREYNIYAIPFVSEELSNYKLSFENSNLAVTFTNGEPFAIVRGITNLENQISQLCSYDNSTDTIYYKDNQNNYCCVSAYNVSSVINHQVIDKFAIFESVNRKYDDLNTIDTEKLEFFNPSLDWNSRNSLFFSDDCGLVFSDKNICQLYNDYLLSIRQRDDLTEQEQTQYIYFVSAINAQYLSAQNGVGENWCSSLVGVQALKNVPSVFLGSDTMNNNGYFGFNNENVYYIGDDKNDYAEFFIDNYLSNILDNLPTTTTAIYYRFSMPKNNPDLIDMVDIATYPSETNVLLNVCMFDKLYASYYTYWFVKANKNVYSLQINGTTLEPVFSYELLTQGTFNGLFVINGSIYGFTDEYICPVSYNEGVITQGNAIINIKGLQYIESTPYQAFFYSPSDRSIYAFVGDNSISKIFESNRITDIYKAFYNTATQDIWCLTNDGILCIQIDNTMIKLETVKYSDIGQLFDKVYLVANGNEIKQLSYNYDETLDKEVIELETEFYGVDDFTVSETDCVYIRIATDEDFNDWIGDVKVYSQVLTQLSKTTEEKTFHIEKSMWDKETNTILLRYQPKYQQGIGFSLGIKSDFPISAIYINSTPLAITNSKNNI